MVLDTESEEPPAGKGIMRVIGVTGYFAAGWQKPVSGKNKKTQRPQVSQRASFLLKWIEVRLLRVGANTLPRSLMSKFIVVL